MSVHLSDGKQIVSFVLRQGSNGWFKILTPDGEEKVRGADAAEEQFWLKIAEAAKGGFTKPIFPDGRRRRLPRFGQDQRDDRIVRFTIAEAVQKVGAARVIGNLATTGSSAEKKLRAVLYSVQTERNVAKEGGAVNKRWGIVPPLATKLFQRLTS